MLHCTSSTGQLQQRLIYTSQRRLVLELGLSSRPVEAGDIAKMYTQHMASRFTKIFQ